VSLPAPVRGLVVRHAFLWSHEKAAGRDEGSKERPAAIVVVSGPDESGDVRVSVVPITHSPPEDPHGGLELPDEVKRQLGLDPERQWAIFDEVNRFVWPGYDLRKVPRTGADSYGCSLSRSSGASSKASSPATGRRRAPSSTATDPGRGHHPEPAPPEFCFALLPTSIPAIPSASGRCAIGKHRLSR
jgi:hypothetical protein